MPVTPPSTAFLRNALAIVKPKSGVTPGTITQCPTAAQITAITDNTDCAQFLSGGKSFLYVLPSASLDIADYLTADGNKNFKFFTLLISSDFAAADLADLDAGSFAGVAAYAFTDKAAAKTFAAQTNRCGFYALSSNKSTNMFFSFSSLLGAPSWDSRQYIELPASEGITELGDAEALFEDRVSFVLSSEQYGNRLAFFAAGGKAITAAYIKEEIRISQQGRALTYIQMNKPDYTITEAKLLQGYLQKQLDAYVEAKTVSSARAEVTVTEDGNFQAGGNIYIPEPKALWRLAGKLTQEVA